MINPKELRLGNMVYWDVQDKTYLEISMMSFDSLYVFDKIQPIPLTEEIMDKIGKRNLLSSSTEPCWIIDGLLYQLSDFQLQKGLHWFQNYYYFRTGNELNHQI